MEKITFKTRQKPSISATNLNQLQDNVEEAITEATKNEYVLAYLNEDLIVNATNWVHYDFALTEKENTTNSKITLNSDGKLVIGADVKCVEISFSINLDKRGIATAVYGRLSKNNSVYAQNISDQNVNYDSISKTIIMPVSEGDIISLGYVFTTDTTTSVILGTPGSFFETYMCIKVIG